MQTQGAFELSDQNESSTAVTSSMVNGCDEANYSTWSAREILLGLRKDNERSQGHDHEDASGDNSENHVGNITIHSREIYVSDQFIISYL